MALTANTKVDRRGMLRGQAFGYPIAPGEVIYTGGLIGVNAAGQAQRIQTAGTVAFVGVAQNGFSNVGVATPGPNVTGSLGDDWALTVPGATMANINAPIYATDDNTLTLAKPGAGFQAQVGWLAGIDNGQTCVLVQGH